MCPYLFDCMTEPRRRRKTPRDGSTPQRHTWHYVIYEHRGHGAASATDALWRFPLSNYDGQVNFPIGVATIGDITISPTNVTARGPDVIENAREALSQEAKTGSPQEHQLLFAKLYGELRRVAQRELKRRTAALTLSPTTLLHETFLNIIGRASVVFTDNGKFMSYAAQAMRGLIVDYLRRRHSEKRGGGLEITSLPTEPPYIAEPEGDALQIEKLNTALESLAQIDPPLAEFVELKYFCGLSVSEIAHLREVSERTVERDWERARLMLDYLIADREDELQSAS